MKLAAVDVTVPVGPEAGSTVVSGTGAQVLKLQTRSAAIGFPATSPTPPAPPVTVTV